MFRPECHYCGILRNCFKMELVVEIVMTTKVFGTINTCLCPSLANICNVAICWQSFPNIIYSIERTLRIEFRAKIEMLLPKPNSKALPICRRIIVVEGWNPPIKWIADDEYEVSRCNIIAIVNLRMEHTGSVAWEYPRRLYSIITVEVKANRAPDMVDPAVLPTCTKQAFLSDGTDSRPYFWSLSMYCGSSRPGQIISYGCSCLVEPRREAALMTVTAPRIDSYQ